MDDQTKLTLAAALLGGYALGRTKKGKLALSVGTYLAGKRFGLEPRRLATEGMRMLGEIPQVAEVQDQLKRGVPRGRPQGSDSGCDSRHGGASGHAP